MLCTHSVLEGDQLTPSTPSEVVLKDCRRIDNVPWLAAQQLVRVVTKLDLVNSIEEDDKSI